MGTEQIHPMSNTKMCINEGLDGRGGGLVFTIH